MTDKIAIDMIECGLLLHKKNTSSFLVMWSDWLMSYCENGELWTERRKREKMLNMWNGDKRQSIECNSLPSSYIMQNVIVQIFFILSIRVIRRNSLLLASKKSIFLEFLPFLFEKIHTHSAHYINQCLCSVHFTLKIYYGYNVYLYGNDDGM